MASESKGAKILLLIACIFGVLQGLLTFIGGFITSFDSDKNVIFRSYCSSMMRFSDMHGVYFLSSLVSRINRI